MRAYAMRTTIEISDKNRGILLSLAAQRGLRGYSSLIEEALDFYIEHRLKNAAEKIEILKMKGSWKTGETKRIKANLNQLRENWSPL
jgi:hypothetical protein